MEEKTEAKNESMHGAHRAMWRAAFLVDVGLARRLVYKRNMDPKKKTECKDPPRAFLDNNCLAL